MWKVECGMRNDCGFAAMRNFKMLNEEKKRERKKERKERKKGRKEEKKKKGKREKGKMIRNEKVKE
ncbi:MAG: hypothetical protein MR592_08845 [Prevotella sp.]|nr:hypothetical protein [Prevotella sp.]